MANPSSSQDSDSINPVLLPSLLRCDEKKFIRKLSVSGLEVFRGPPKECRKYTLLHKLPTYSPGLRAAEQTGHCPGIARDPGLSGSHLGGPQSRSPEKVLTEPARYLLTGDDFYEKH